MFTVRNFIYFISCILLGCGGNVIAKSNYSPLKTPIQTYTFAKKAVGKDDYKAFYYCLSERTKRLITLDELKIGWALAGSFFYIFLESKVENLKYINPEQSQAKLQIKSHELKANFLLVKDRGKWKLMYPSPYPLPDISKLKRQKIMPWRKERVFYQKNPQDWLKTVKIKRKNGKSLNIQKVPWRKEDNFYQISSEQWYRKRKKIKKQALNIPDREPEWRMNDVWRRSSFKK